MNCSQQGWGASHAQAQPSFAPGQQAPGTIGIIHKTVAAGFPSPALDYMEERIDLTRAFVPHPLTTFLFQCEGDSMINAFIPRKAWLLVDRSLTPVNGDIIVGVLNGQLLVKFLKKNDRKCWLIPANSKYPDVEITPETDFRVWGVVTHVITGKEMLRACMR
ncbi:MAG: translesion error-prone DNA polymerase V autoproteolytic subunit [Bacteroidetes bacterium]|nr:translesion error-prone DNA polymerase V autoproteolytic subunit [Bacteroidota bacterium]